MIEIKIRELDQRCPWEDIAPITVIQPEELDEEISRLKRLYTFAELRYNHNGSYQGHYVPGNIGRFEAIEAIGIIEDYGHSVYKADKGYIVIWACGKTEQLSGLILSRLADEILRSE